MKISIETFFRHKHAPLYQAGGLLVIILVLNILGMLVESIGLADWDVLYPWVISGSLMLGYTLLNTLIGLTSDMAAANYYGKSISGFLLMALGGAVLAKTFSSVSLGEAGSMWWIYVVITVSYLIFMGIMLLMKTIINFAQNEDENFRQKK